jgi:hypothetical protein
VNQFPDEVGLCREQFADVSIFQRISSLTRLGCVPNHFPHEFMLQRISSLMRLCGASNQFDDESVLHQISSLTILSFIESVL